MSNVKQNAKGGSVYIMPSEGIAMRGYKALAVADSGVMITKEDGLNMIIHVKAAIAGGAAVCIGVIQSLNGVLSVLHDVSTLVTVTKDTDAKVNVYYENDVLVVQNELGAARDLDLSFIAV